MKSKYLVLLTMCMAFCLLGCSCKGDDPQGSSVENSGNSEISAPTESAEEEKPADFSVNQNAVTCCIGETFTLVAEAEF